MGTDTKAVVYDVKVDDFLDWIKGKFSASINKTSSEGYLTASFNYKKEPRILSIFYGGTFKHDFSKREYGHLKGYKKPKILLSLGMWGESVEIMKVILEEYGGMIDENDCDGEDYYFVEGIRKKQREFLGSLLAVL